MKIYEASVRKPITTLLVFVAVILFGLYSLTRLPIDMLPEIDPPYISVVTFYPGASAEDIETNVTKILENNLNTVSDLKEISSTSMDNVSMVSLEFEWGSNLDEASNSVRDVISRVTRLLPDGVEQPTVLKFNTSMIPILQYIATAEESYEVLPELLEDVVANPLNRINGIGAINIDGGADRRIMVDVDPLKLEAYNLTVEGIGAILASENTNVPAGTIDLGNTTFSLRVQGEFPNSGVVQNLVVGQFQGKAVYLRDVARVRDSLDRQSYVARSNGHRAVRISIQKQSGANTVALAKAVQAEMPRLIRNLPPDVKVQEAFNSAEEIQSSINSLSETVIYAALFVVLVVLFFLGRWRATFIIVLTIPVSLIAAFIYLNFSGNSLNIISLSSLSIAIGMVVDDAIVVLENITTHLERGSSPREAAIYGTNEVALSVVASTLTIIAVFLPLTMISGFSGIMFKQLGMSVTIVITVSIAAALTLTPMLASRIMKAQEKRFREEGNWVQRRINWVLTKLDNGYAHLLTFCTRHRLWVIVGATLVFLASLLLFPRIRVEFMPQSDNSHIKATIYLTNGARLEYTGTVVDQIERQLRAEIPEVNLLSTSYGSAGSNNLFAAFSSNGSNIINIDVGLVKPRFRTRSTNEISDQVRAILAQYPEIERMRVQANSGNGGGGSSAPTVDINVMGHDLDKMTAVAEALAAKMRSVEGVRDVDVQRDAYKREFDIQFDRERLALMGLNTATASQFVSHRINGLVPTKFRENGKEYDVRVRYADEFRQSVEDIENITLYTKTGSPFKLREVATVRQIYTPPSIKRENRLRVVKVQCALQQASIDKVVDAVWKAVDEVEIPQEVSIGVGGTAKEQAESNSDLMQLLILVVILVYIVMASQFESFRAPFIIMLSLPFAFSGVLLGLWLTDNPLNMISIIGAIMLVGIVVKNGIVLVDYTNLLRERGYATMRAVVDAGKSRLRPVLMTSLTTILGMVPLAVSRGEGSEMWRAMGVAVIGGLTFSTFLTLLVIPTVYASFVGRSTVSNRRKQRRGLQKGNQGELEAKQ